MSRGLGRVERAILEIVQLPEFAATTEEYGAGQHADGVPIELLALYVAKGAPAGGLQRLPTRAEYMEGWRAARRIEFRGGVYTKASMTDVLPRSVIVSTRRAVSHLRKLGLIECRWSLPMRVMRLSTEEEKTRNAARLAEVGAMLAAIRKP